MKSFSFIVIFHLPIVQPSPWSLPLKDAYEDTASPKSFVHRRWEKSWLVCQREEGDANDMYTVAVKTDRAKTVQIKLNNDLLSFQLCLMIDFVLSERKLAHGPIKFPARSIGHTNSTLDTKYHMYMYQGKCC